MKFVNRLKFLSKQSKEAQPANRIKFNKQCPHCSSRGIFVFNDKSKIKPINGETNEKDK